MKMQEQNPADREILMKEFHDIVKDAEEKIKADRDYPRTEEWREQQRRLTKIMTVVEGCGCDGRGGYLRSMFESLRQGNTGVTMTFAPLVFKSFHRDFKRILKIL